MNAPNEPQANARNAQNAAGGEKPLDTKLPLLASVVSILLCCNFLFGSIALVLAVQAINAEKSGDFETARINAKRAMALVIVGVVMSALLGVYQLAHFTLTR